eukprot:TRINITY_DN3358_c0_g1_i1.p1 TRINITY_DN3358_c0_g1~~TRINITY_DN3358_c0_g1_i1.p1  ORF type:complete len:446 (+),score=102.36 TRINITY_DN3358_c0_g1_i1:106-1443(+)
MVNCFLVAVLLTLAHSSLANARGTEVVGYWENWNDVNWWENNVPGNCQMGCAKPDVFMQMISSYSSVNYGFTFLTTNPNPDQVSCSNTSNNCPLWDGKAIYIAANQAVITFDTTINNIDTSSGLIGIGEFCRLARQGPAGPRRCLITLGGWSDWARVGTVENAQSLAKLISNLVQFTFADGIDLDFEHLTEFSVIDNGHDEFLAFSALINAIKGEFSKITSQVWSNNAQTRSNYLQQVYNAMPDWQKSESYYYPTNIAYLQQVANNGPPYFEVSWTTRFNAFIDPNNPWNYLAPNSPIPTGRFETDGEGSRIWNSVHNAVDVVNVMAYDAGSSAGPLIFNFPQILENFKNYGPVAKDKINMGFEPGDQAAGGHWEGLEVDVATTKYIQQQQYGGAMIWAINANTANSSHWCPIVASSVYQILQPSYPYNPVPQYTKVNPQTGWNN